MGLPFLDETPKGTSLADFTRFEPFMHANPFTGFPVGELTKNGALQKVTKGLYFTYLRGIPHSTN